MGRVCSRSLLGLFVIVALTFFAVATVVVADLNPDNIRTTVQKFILCQNTRNASLCASLFDVNGKIEIPVGSSVVVGRSNIDATFTKFFTEGGPIKETLLTEILINNNWAGLSKMFAMVTSKGCVVSLEMTNWFSFDPSPVPGPPLIKTFAEIFNVTDFAKQADC